jgi:hypothetical protein
MIAYVTTNTTYFVKGVRCVGARSHRAGARAHVPEGATLVSPPRLGDPLVFFVNDERKVVTTAVTRIAT